jgi:hypothetical protein
MKIIVIPLYFIIRIKIEFLAYFYSIKYEIKLESDNELHHSRVLFINSSKRLNYYNVPMT